MTTAGISAPETDLALYSPDALREPFEHYRTLRDLGPVVRLTEYDLYGMFRYDDVRAALVDWERFSSAQGIAMNATCNELSEGSILGMDPPRHRTVRKVLDDALRPRYVRAVAGDIERLADRLVDDLMRRGEFDGVADFACKLPVDIVMDLIGFPRDEYRTELLDWALGAFNYMGPDSELQRSTFPDVQALMRYLVTEATPDRLLPDSFGQIVWAAADRGEITEPEALMTMSAYACAGLDTTIAGIAATLWLLARDPEQWQAVREDPKLIPGAFLEGVRMESPIQSFSRVATCDVDVDGVTIPAGARVVLSYGSANRDERHYPDPDRFLVRRNPVDTLGFGSGVHHCPGRALSSMEAHAVFTALAKRASTIELAGEPTRTPNNITRGLDSLPVRIR
ncbi:cytochrome P450 [Nocardia sp. CDC159]|uniref:Cytochrome P450 n=1 Tax=Nocardia pulmonis TaxID=2951408 RepID=A0A9X2ECD1_9NOCA|nr:MULTISPECIES: cytochrome P450 [Nocardia]MCM6778287.1 cytochrome P450 [Nocardia pulmonis]MCM6791176.1 cytochrome P450 [Nocardia sp. CDC159]